MSFIFDNFEYLCGKMTNDISQKTEGLCENDKELEEDVIIDEDGDLSPKQKRIFVKMLAKFIRWNCL